MPEMTQEQIDGLNNGVKKIQEIVEKAGTKTDAVAEKLEVAEKTIEKLQSEITELRRSRIQARTATSGLRTGQVVTDDCAKWLGSMFVLMLNEKGALNLDQPQLRECVINLAKKNLGELGFEVKSTLTTSDIPLPTDYSGQVVELVWKYGQARQLGTVYPLGTGTVKLPKLSTSPAFGLISQAGSVTEKSPQIAFVTFTPAKWGGIVRYPSEIEADSIVPLGQFLARYIARETAKIEDVVFFTADGSGTYNSLTGILGQEITLGNKIVASTGNTAPSNLTLANFRSVRGKVASAALGEACYYMNATMENLLASFNTSSTVTPYIANGPNGPTLDGFPIKWVDVMPVYTTSATVSANQVGFGALSYHYLGVRAGLQVDLSRDVYFNTDEWALRALERFTTGLMADSSNATLALAAS